MILFQISTSLMLSTVKMFDQGEIFYDALFGDKEAGKNTSKWNYFPYQIVRLQLNKEN